MPKFAKFALITLVSLIVLLIVAMVVVVNVINPNEYKPQITQLVQQQTGRQLQINGNISWSLFPWLGFKVNDVTLGNAKGFGSAPFVKFQQVTASIHLLPLLEHKVKIGTLKLKDLQLNLMTNAQGETNWQDFAGSSNKPKVKVAAKPKKNSTPNIQIDVHDIDISNANLHWQNAQTHQNIQLRALNFQSQNAGLNRAFNIDFDTTISNNITHKKLFISASTTAKISDHLNQVDLHRFSLTVNNLNVEGNLNIKGIKDNPNVKGDINIKSFNPRKLMSKLGINSYQPRDTKALTGVAMNLAFEGTPNNINVSKLKLNVDKTKISGTASVKNLASQPAVQFDIKVNHLNTDNYMPPKPQAPKQKTTAASVTSTTPATAPKATKPVIKPLNLAPLRKLNIDGKIYIDQLTAMNIKLKKAGMQLIAKQGLIQIQALSAKLYKGNTTTNITLDARSNTPSVRINSQLKGLQVQPFLTDFMNKKFISGVANFNINLTGSGTNADSLLKTLSGSTSFALKKGEIHGLSIDQQIEVVKAAIKKQPIPKLKRKNTTPFGSITGSSQLSNGVANSANLVISNPLFTANGNGNINLVAQTMDYTLTVHTKNAGDVDKFEIPITLKGDMNKPVVQLGLNSILNQLLGQKTQLLGKHAQGQVNNFLKKNSAVIGQLFK
tara:strand:- start:26997 stop:28994 length:1998 start_codon:yes stop_codon:yes gene_type:complete